METPVKVVCPYCHQPSENIKRMQLWGILFVLIGIIRQTRTLTACANCMRRQIGINAAINILTANVLFPFTILPMSIYQFARTYQAGHSESIQDEIWQANRPRPDNMPDFPNLAKHFEEFKAKRKNE